MTYKLIIFDFDGTLADSFPWFINTINSVADKYKFKRVDAADLDSFRGFDAGYLLKKYGVPVWKIPIIANHMRSLMAGSISQISLFKGVSDVLHRLSAKGKLLAIVSSNSRNNVTLVLGQDNASLIRYYECGVSISGKKSKIQKILRLTGVNPEETLVIGDEIRDGEAAKKTHVAFGAVSWGYNSIESLRELSPSLVFNTVEEIPEKLFKRD
jgi:phosphoglycolate phosphatase